MVFRAVGSPSAAFVVITPERGVPPFGRLSIVIKKAEEFGETARKMEDDNKDFFKELK